MKKKHKRKILIGISSIAAVLALLAIGCGVYLGDYYRADTEAITAFAAENDVIPETLKDNTIVYEPEGATIGFIFYPGGKVEYIAYKPLMELRQTGKLFWTWYGIGQQESVMWYILTQSLLQKTSCSIMPKKATMIFYCLILRWGLWMA